MGKSPDLSDYVEVADRLAAFFADYPDGSVRATDPVVVEVAGDTRVHVAVEVYRTPDDPQPARASAWEPYPGKTPYTRDSEAMNCETSAAGRALAFLGYTSKRSSGRQTISTREEVAARQPAGPDPTDPSTWPDGEMPVALAKNAVLHLIGDSERAKAWWEDHGQDPMPTQVMRDAFASLGGGIATYDDGTDPIKVNG